LGSATTEELENVDEYLDLLRNSKLEKTARLLRTRRDQL